MLQRTELQKESMVRNKTKLKDSKKLEDSKKLKFFNFEVEKAVLKLQMKLKDYQKSPESHPLYTDEWTSFWSKKYKKVLEQGNDANSYDYTPEWTVFWIEKLRDLHNVEVKKKEEILRIKFRLSKNAVRKRNNSPSPRCSTQKYIETSSDDSSEQSSEPKHKRYRSDRSNHFTERSSSYKSEHYSCDFYYNRYHIRNPSPEITDNGPINLITVCRFLCALEPELGLMAKTIHDLLAKAVALEKLNPNSADHLLFVSENCNVMETVKEKLKGVLSASIIEPNRIGVVKRAVLTVTKLMHEIKLETPTYSNFEISKMALEKTAEETAEISLDDPIAEQKMKIAMIISKKLMKEGRSNFSHEELEILVESFINEN